MNAEVLPGPSTPFAGGFYGGRILIAGVAYALIVAPKAEGHCVDVQWNRSSKVVEGATSYYDGRANTLAMAEAGSDIARWALDLRIGGFDDWYIASQDELEVIYRSLKPGVGENSLWGRSGINVSAMPPTYPYTATSPAQTDNELFRAGGAEAFDEEVYWTSTQRESCSGDAWGQNFADGYQSYWYKYDDLRARAVRRLTI